MEQKRRQHVVAGLLLLAAGFAAIAAVVEAPLVFVAAGLITTLVAFVLAVRGLRRASSPEEP